MNVKYGSIPVGAGQKVAENQKPLEAKKAFTIAWDRNLATIGAVVGISGSINIPIENPSQIRLRILFNNSGYAFPDKTEIKNGEIIAQWKVTPYKVGTFTSGGYDVEVNYGGLTVKTSTPLKIVAAGADRFSSSFG